MARLSKHGRELLRIEVEYPVTPDGDLGRVDARKVVKSYRSDGHIMRKDCAHFAADGDRAGYWHDWGWKLYKKFKAGIDLPAACERAALRVEALAAENPDSTSTVKVTRGITPLRIAG